MIMLLSYVFSGPNENAILSIRKIKSTVIGSTTRHFTESLNSSDFTPIVSSARVDAIVDKIN